TRHEARWACFCNLCAHDWTGPLACARKFASIEDLIRRTGVRRDELAVLSDIGALAAYGRDRRTALWQIEKAVRPEGELFQTTSDERRATSASPLKSMTAVERMAADFAGTGLTIGPHPM